MRVFLLSLFAAGSVLAQFQDLATPDDGSALYFSSALRLAGSDQYLHAKLFLMDPAGIHLYAQQAPGDSIGRTTANFYQLVAPDVSADGKVLAYTATRPCYGGSGCLSVETRQGHITGLPGQPEQVFAGFVRISRNGRFAIAFGSTALFPTPTTRFIDLQSGQVTALPAAYNLGGSGRRRITLDGAVVVSSGSQLALWRTSGAQTLTNSQTPSEPMINDDGTLVIYQTTGAAPKLIVYDVTSGRETTLATKSGTDAGTFGASLTGDGSLILFLSQGQAYLVRSDGSGLRQISHEPAGIVEALLTGNGQFIYAVTGEGRMLRIDAGSGTVLELVGRTPNISGVSAGVAPGALLEISGAGLSDATSSGGAPLPTTLAGVQVKLGGVPMPLALVSPTRILWQIPWYWPPGDAPFQLLSGASPFSGAPDTLHVSPRDPQFYQTADPAAGTIVVAVHQNWDALVSSQNPAQAGEVIHLYLRGLGAVDPPVPEGTLAPADPPARVVTPPVCQAWDGGPNGVQILYAGLAPGMIGIDQMEMVVPGGLRLTPVTLNCGYGTDSAEGALGSLPVVVGTR